MRWWELWRSKDHALPVYPSYTTLPNPLYNKPPLYLYLSAHARQHSSGVFACSAPRLQVEGLQSVLYAYSHAVADTRISRSAYAPYAQAIISRYRLSWSVQEPRSCTNDQPRCVAAHYASAYWLAAVYQRFASTSRRDTWIGS
jgi:hypothetical protein